MNKQEELALLEEARIWTKSQMEVTAGHDWMHIERVVKNTRTLARKEGADLLVCELAAIMHDVVNLPKNDGNRKQASTLSAHAAAQFLEGKLSRERIALIYEAIQAHSYSAGFIPVSLEAKVVSDADNLDALGAIGIARTFECGGAMATPTLAAEDPFCEHRRPADHLYTVDHFYKKLLLLEKRFYTESGRRAARRRVDFMNLFLEELRLEVLEGVQ